MLKPQISFILLDTRAKRKPGLSKELADREVVDRIEDLMKTALRTEGGLYEWIQSSHSG